MNYTTIIVVVVFCLFILMFVGSSKDNRFEAEILKVAPNDQARFIVAAPNGDLILTNKTVKGFANDINARDGELIADYINRDNNVTNAYKTADGGLKTDYINRDNNVINAYKAADVNYYKSNQTDAQNRANAAARAANNNTNRYYVKKNTNYTMTADGAVLGRGNQDNWGERYVTWTGSKGVRQSKFLIK